MSSNDPRHPPPARGTQATAELDPLEGGVLRVLVVEDLPRVQQLLRELIHVPGRLEVAGLAETEQEALAQFEQLVPHAVVVDLNLKSGTGLGVITGLRRRPQGGRPLLIVLTNHALPVLESACLKAGADYFLDKSRDFHMIRILLEHAWSRHSELPATLSPAGPHGAKNGAATGHANGSDDASTGGNTLH